MSVQINSDNVERGFFATWLILYAQDPDDGEVPYTVLGLENEPEWIRPSSSIVGKLATFDIIAAVGAVDKVTASIDPEAFLTAGEVKDLLKEHNTDPEAHPDLFQEVHNVIEAWKGQILDINVTIPQSGWKKTDLKKSYPMSIDVACKEAAAEHIPEFRLDGASLDAAKAAGLCAAVTALEGILRFYSQVAPTAEMGGIMTLRTRGAPAAAGGSGTAGISGIATRSTPGAVKPGTGLSVGDDGTLSLDLGNGLKYDAAGKI